MRVLLDHCIPRRVRRSLEGLVVATVAELGWATHPDGAVLRAAVGRFDAFVSVDRGFASLPVPPSLAVVLLRAKSNRPEDILPLVPALRQALLRPARGRVTVLVTAV